MQAGSKIERAESPAMALSRELKEEIGVSIELQAAHYLEHFTAPAANEPRAVG